MLIWLQIVGIVFALIMGYVTFYNYRRKEIRFSDLLVWGPIWLVFLYILVQTFNVSNAVELFTIAGFMFMVTIVFYLFKLVRQQQRKLKRIVKFIALKKIKLR